MDPIEANRRDRAVSNLGEIVRELRRLNDQVRDIGHDLRDIRREEAVVAEAKYDVELDEEAVDAAGAALADRVGDEPWCDLDDDSKKAIRDEVRATIRDYLAHRREGSRPDAHQALFAALRRGGP